MIRSSCRRAITAARLGTDSCGALTIASSLACAPRISGVMRAASGRFFQYLTGISRFMASIFSRAGLKMLA